MPKRLNKPILVKTRDENGNYITLNMSTGSRKTNYQTNQSTSINKSRRKQNVKRTLKPGQQVFTDWRTGKRLCLLQKQPKLKVIIVVNIKSKKIRKLLIFCIRNILNKNN